MDAIRRLSTTSATTKRPPAVSSGKRGVRVANLTSLSIVPLVPLSTKTAERMGLEGQAAEKWETFVVKQSHTDSGTAVNQVPDIKEDDEITVSSTDYKVIGVADWPATANTAAYKQIVLEERKP